jgi:maltose alpha-D-glucosyltransferase / alpha-amylase
MVRHQQRGLFRRRRRRPDPPAHQDGPFAFDHINVTNQRRDPESLLLWFERMLQTLRECEEIGIGQHSVIPFDQPGVLAHRAQAPSGSILFLHNLTDQPVSVSLPKQPDEDGTPVEAFSDREYDDLDLRDLTLNAYGYRWIRLCRTHSRFTR